MALLLAVVRGRCGKESSRSLSHLLMSFLVIWLLLYAICSLVILRVGLFFKPHDVGCGNKEDEIYQPYISVSAMLLRR